MHNHLSNALSDYQDAAADVAAAAADGGGDLQIRRTDELALSCVVLSPVNVRRRRR